MATPAQGTQTAGRGPAPRTEELKVRDLMTDEVVTVRAGEDLAKIMDTMDSVHIRHMPVIDDEGNLIGIISVQDILQYALQGADVLPLSDQRQLLREISASEVMRTSAVTVEPDASAAEAGRTLMEMKISCLPVTEGSKLVGILTETDFVRHVVRDQEGE